MPISKNPGPPLTSIFKGVLEAIPLRWRTKLGITRVDREQPVDVPPSTLAGNLVVSAVEQVRTNERKKTDITIGDPTNQIMTEFIRTKDGQVGTRIVKFLPEGTALPTLTEFMVDAGQEAYGNGYVEQFITSVPNVFGGNDYSKERRDVIPADFGALIQTTETATTIAGTASMPTLGTGELFKKEEQVTEQTKRVTTRSRDLASLPRTLVNKKTNPDKQVVTVTRTWELDTTTPAVPTALQDVEFTKLGDGTAIEEVLGVANVFGGRDYTKERPDRAPPDFGALLQINSFEETVSGTAADPTLGVGELFREEKQVTEFTKRVTVRSRNVAGLPITLTGVKTSRDKQVVTVTRTWGLDSMSVPPPTALLDVELTKLGDGTAILETLGVPNVFGGRDYTREVPDRVPPEFSALIQVTETQQNLAGIASDPTLAVGDLFRAEKQIDEFTFRRTIRGRNVGTLPRSSISTETNQDKQVVTVTKFWLVATQPSAVPSATMDVTFQPLGDGTAIETRNTLTEVFAASIRRVTIPDIIPEELRVALPTKTSTETSAGTANPDPALGVGELSRTEEQVAKFIKRITVESRGTLVLPVDFHAKRALSEDHGGGNIDVIWRLDAFASLIQLEGRTILQCEIKNLGNGLGLRSTTKLKAVNNEEQDWPILVDRLWDEKYRINYTRSRQTVATGTGQQAQPPNTWAWVSEVIEENKWRAVRTNTGRFAPVAIDEAHAIVQYVFKPYKFPGLLASLSEATFRQASARLVRHTIKTWFEKSVATPNHFPFSEVITDTALAVSISGSVTQINDALHDDYVIGGQFFPRTTPSFSEYTGSILATGQASCVGGTNVITGTGTNFSGELQVGDRFGGYQSNIIITSISSQTVMAVNITLPAFGPTPFYVCRPSIGWIGNLRVIYAEVTQEPEPNIWKHTTHSVIMR